MNALRIATNESAFVQLPLKLIRGGLQMASKKDIETVWEKAKPVRGKDPDVWRKDVEGNPIRHGSYGTQGEYGWEIDHKHPVSKGGSDHQKNLQPLHWEANREKSDKVRKK